MVLTAITLLVACIMAAKGASLTGSFFHEQQFPESNLLNDTAGTSHLQRSFHLCSLKSECNYVIQDIRTGEFHFREKEEDLPGEKRHFRIWKKAKPVTHCDSNPCKNGGKCVPDIASYSCVCDAGSTGRNCENAITCKFLKEVGKKSGTYKVLLPSGIFQVYCEMDINGGVYTFISKNTRSRIQQSDIDIIFTDRSHVLLRLLKPDNHQPYTIIQQYIDTGGVSVQVNAFVNYTQPRNHALSDYLFLGLLPKKHSHRYQTEGLMSNGVNLTFRNCDGNPNSYFAFFSAEVQIAQNSGPFNDGSLDSRWRTSAIYPNPQLTMPAEFFMFTELHFGGCGCYTESSRWPSWPNAANATAIGLR